MHADIVRRSHVLVIDDNEFPYLPLFRKDGYNVTQWNDVEDIRKLEQGEFDVILLDLFGVGASQSNDQGLGILRHIRTANPAQILIAYSNAEWSVDYQPFFERADMVLHKTKTDYYGFKQAVDRLLDERYSLGFYVNRAIVELGDNASAMPKIDKRLRKAILSGDAVSIRPFLVKHLDDAVTIDRVLTIIGIAITTAQIWIQ